MLYISRFYFLAFFQIVITISIIGQSNPQFLQDHNAKWVEDQMAKMTLDHKIGQLLMPRGNTSGKPIDVQKLATWVKDYKIGGIVFFAGPPTTQALATNYLQSISDVPLFIGEDFEWGLAMRMDSTDRFPYQMSLGAIQGNESLVQSMGEEIGRQCKRLGVHINYAPVVDVNNNINNPVINFRSFGSNKNVVAAKGLAYMKGLQSQNIIATAKHFPGHGDTNVDSHHDLPIIPHSIERLTDVELYPFQQLINQGLSGIMTSHLEVPSLEKKNGLAATFSKSIITDLLRSKMGFKGLTFTDAMDMKGAIKNFPKGEAMVEAILAGNDILETFEDLPQAVEAIKSALKSGKLSENLLNERVRKILMAKAWVGLNQYKPIEIVNLVNDLNSEKSDLLNRQFAESLITVVTNKGNAIPMENLDESTIVISIDANEETNFQKMAAMYHEVDFMNLQVNASDSIISNSVEKVKKYKKVIVGLHLKEVRASSKYSLNDSNKKLVSLLGALPNSHLVIFGNMLSLPMLNTDGYRSITLGFQDTKYTQEAAAQVLYGGLPSRGKLPMTLSDSWKEGFGFETSVSRMSYGHPSQANIDGKKLNHKIDSIIQMGLKQKAFPGAVVQVIKDGKSIFHKSYGFHTYEQAIDNFKNSDLEKIYDNNQTDAMDFFGDKKYINSGKIEGVKNLPSGLMLKSDIFDLASITKIASSAYVIMKLTSEDKFSLSHTLSQYIEETTNKPIGKLKFIDMSTHRSGLKAWIPFWKLAIDSTSTIKNYIKDNPKLDSVFVYKTTKPSFFKRLFGKKTTKTILWQETMQRNPKLFDQSLKANTIVWKSNTFDEKNGLNHFPVASNLYLNKSFNKSIFQAIEEAPINPSQGYVYSDMHYYFYPRIVKKITDENFPKFIDKDFVKMGMNTLVYNPLTKFSKQRIVPTEYDSIFRKSLIHGMVHDEGATMMEGISGHAGLFGNSNDLCKLMFLYLNKGKYGNEQIIDSKVIESFTKYQFPEEKNRRGIFFDKPDLVNKSNAPKLSSPSSFGHSGFTGTYAWVDPQYNLIYVVLTNRVYPTRNNNKISELNIRPAIGDAIIESIKD